MAVLILVLLVYQGSLSLAARIVANSLDNPETSPYIMLATGVGRLIIVAIGFNLLEITKIRVASFLSAIAFYLLIYHLANFF